MAYSQFRVKGYSTVWRRNGAGPSVSNSRPQPLSSSARIGETLAIAWCLDSRNPIGDARRRCVPGAHDFQNTTKVPAIKLEERLSTALQLCRLQAVSSRWRGRLHIIPWKLSPINRGFAGMASGTGRRCNRCGKTP